MQKLRAVAEADHWECNEPRAYMGAAIILSQELATQWVGHAQRGNKYYTSSLFSCEDLIIAARLGKYRARTAIAQQHNNNNNNNQNVRDELTFSSFRVLDARAPRATRLAKSNIQ